MHTSLKYDFPRIETLADVAKYIDNVDFKDSFYIHRKDWYTVVGYHVNFEHTFKWHDDDEFGSAIRRECRGLIFNSDNELISRPYHKFFNVGEKEELGIDQVDFNTPHRVYEKLDGSMIRPIPIDMKTGDFRLGTKAGVTDVAMNAETWVASKPNYNTFIRQMVTYGLTPIFEWCSRKNRIVVDYPEDRLVLTAIRDTIDGNYLTYDNLNALAQIHNIDLVKSYENNSEDVVHQVRKWNTDDEGIVIRFDEGHMLKVKSENYLQLHKGKSAIANERNVVELVVNDKVDDVVPLLSTDDADRLRKFQLAFWFQVDECVSDIVDTYLNEGGADITDKKQFATQFVSTLPRHIHHFMYGLHQGRGCKEMVVDAIKKSTNSIAKFEQGKWMWGNLNWYEV